MPTAAAWVSPGEVQPASKQALAVFGCLERHLTPDDRRFVLRRLAASLEDQRAAGAGEFREHMATVVRRFLGERPDQSSECRYDAWCEEVLEGGGWAPSAKDVMKVLGPWSSVLRIARDGTDFVLVSPRLRSQSRERAVTDKFAREGVVTWVAATPGGARNQQAFKRWIKRTNVKRERDGLARFVCDAARIVLRLKTTWPVLMEELDPGCDPRACERKDGVRGGVKRWVTEQRTTQSLDLAWECLGGRFTAAAYDRLRLAFDEEPGAPRLPSSNQMCVKFKLTWKDLVATYATAVPVNAQVGKVEYTEREWARAAAFAVTYALNETGRLYVSQRVARAAAWRRPDDQPSMLNYEPSKAERAAGPLHYRCARMLSAHPDLLPAGVSLEEVLAARPSNRAWKDDGS